MECNKMTGTSTTTTVGLFTLPLELRLRIYGFACQMKQSGDDLPITEQYPEAWDARALLALLNISPLINRDMNELLLLDHPVAFQDFAALWSFCAWGDLDGRAEPLRKKV